MPLSETAVRRFDVLLARYRVRTALLLGTIWDRLDSYGAADVERFERMAAPVLDGAKRSAVASSSAMFALAFDIPPPGLRAEDVDVQTRIRHPFLAAWHATNEGRPFPEALAVGRSQAQAVAMDFVQQTSRRTGDAVARSADIRTRWRRVPNSDACRWCQDISGQTYATAESADFGHDRCYCMVLPADGAGMGQMVTRTYERGTGRRATGQGSHRTLTEAQRTTRSRPNPRWR